MYLCKLYDPTKQIQENKLCPYQLGKVTEVKETCLECSHYNELAHKKQKAEQRPSKKKSRAEQIRFLKTWWESKLYSSCSADTFVKEIHELLKIKIRDQGAFDQQIFVPINRLLIRLIYEVNFPIHISEIQIDKATHILTGCQKKLRKLLPEVLGILFNAELSKIILELREGDYIKESQKLSKSLNEPLLLFIDEMMLLYHKWTKERVTRDNLRFQRFVNSWIEAMALSPIYSAETVRNVTRKVTDFLSPLRKLPADQLGKIFDLFRSFLAHPLTRDQISDMFKGIRSDTDLFKPIVSQSKSLKS